MERKLEPKEKVNLSNLIIYLLKSAPLIKDYSSQVRNLYIPLNILEKNINKYIKSVSLSTGIVNYIYNVQFTGLKESMKINRVKHVRLGEIIEVLTVILRN